MAFTERFLEVPVIFSFSDGEKHEGEVVEKYENGIEMINPFDISSYSPDGELVNLYMKNSRMLCITMTFNEFEAKLNLHAEGQLKK